MQHWLDVLVLRKTGKKETIPVSFKPEHRAPVTDHWGPGKVRTMDIMYYILGNRNQRDTVNFLDLDSMLSTQIQERKKRQLCSFSFSYKLSERAQTLKIVRFSNCILTKSALALHLLSVGVCPLFPLLPSNNQFSPLLTPLSIIRPPKWVTRGWQHKALNILSKERGMIPWASK